MLLSQERKGSCMSWSHGKVAIITECHLHPDGFIVSPQFASLALPLALPAACIDVRCIVLPRPSRHLPCGAGWARFQFPEQHRTEGEKVLARVAIRPLDAQLNGLPRRDGRKVANLASLSSSRWRRHRGFTILMIRIFLCGEVAQDAQQWLGLDL